MLIKPCSQRGSTTGATLLKQRQLRATGWNVVTVPYSEWYDLHRNATREERFMERLLRPFEHKIWHRRQYHEGYSK